MPTPRTPPRSSPRPPTTTSPSNPSTRPIYLGLDAASAFSVLAPLFAWMVRDLDPAAASRAFDRMRQTLRSHQTADGVAFGSAAWLITARRGQQPHEQTGARS